MWMSALDQKADIQASNQPPEKHISRAYRVVNDAVASGINLSGGIAALIIAILRV